MISIDTEQIKTSGEEIIKISQEFKKTIDSLYSRIYNIPVTGEWQGVSAEFFAKHINNVEKRDAYLIYNSLYKFGESLVESATKYDTEIKNNM